LFAWYCPVLYLRKWQSQAIPVVPLRRAGQPRVKGKDGRGRHGEQAYVVCAQRRWPHDNVDAVRQDGDGTYDYCGLLERSLEKKWERNFSALSIIYGSKIVNVKKKKLKNEKNIFNNFDSLFCRLELLGPNYRV
jgi:hypothetical protein